MEKRNFAAEAAEKFKSFCQEAEGNGPAIWTVENLIRAAAAAAAQEVNADVSAEKAAEIGNKILEVIDRMAFGE